MPIQFEDFEKVDVRVGTVREAIEPKGARRPALLLRIDFGADLGVLRSSAQLTANYSAGQLIGTQVAAVVNLPPRQIGSHMSECLVLGFPDENGEPIVIRPERRVADGGRLW